jgi:phospholipid/cholesterol/gamma-HCH transport system substrate-binding protein
METKANHVLIGAFVLAVIGATFGFVIWLAKVDIDRANTRYHIFFDEAVRGLGLGGVVRFNGIPIGSVAEIALDPDNPARVRVLIEVDAEAPIRTDTVASLAFQGITGVSFVQLSGGGAAAALLKPEKPGQIPIIASKPSALQELFAGAPEIIDRVLLLLDRLALLVGDENRTRIASILVNVDDITASLKAHEPEIGRILQNLERMSADLGQMARDLNGLVGRAEGVLDGADATLAVARGTLSSVDEAVTSVDRVIDNDLRLLIADLRKTAQAMAQVGTRLDGFFDRNEEPLDLFAAQGLVELTKFVEEARLLVAGLQRVLETAESDPARFLFGRQKGGVEAK